MILRDISTGAIDQDLKTVEPRGKNQQEQSRNRTQNRRNGIEGKELLEVLKISSQNLQNIQISFEQH